MAPATLAADGGDYMSFESQERVRKYNEEVKMLERRVAIEKEGYRLEREGRYQEAIEVFQRSIATVNDSANASSAHLSLARIYEKTGQYQKALEQVEWFLKGNQNEQGRQASLEKKQRLLQKIEAQKRGEKIEEPKPTSSVSAKSQPIKRISDFHTAGYGAQKKFLEKELPEDAEIHRLAKQAMLAEHAGKFGEAKKYYEAMLIRKDEAIAAFGESSWVMLHPAVQRTSEVTGDEAREKEMLVWIRDNMLSDQGAYHKYLNGLLPNVQDHLKERIKKFNIQ